MVVEIAGVAVLSAHTAETSQSDSESARGGALYKTPEPAHSAVHQDRPKRLSKDTDHITAKKRFKPTVLCPI